METATITTAGLTAWRALVVDGIWPFVDRRFPLEKLADAFRLELVERHFGKVGIEW